MQKTKIGWCDYTSNPLYVTRKSDGKRGWACTRVSPGCQHCHSERINQRLGTGLEFTKSSEDQIDWVLDPAELEVLQRRGKGVRIFVGDMTDIFHDQVSNEQLAILFGALTLARALQIQLLTKRPQRLYEWTQWVKTSADAEGEDYLGRWCVAQYFTWAHRETVKSQHIPLHVSGLSFIPEHIWIGISAEDQPRFDERWPWLAKVPCHRFLAYEPMLGPLTLSMPDVGEVADINHSYPSANPDEWDDWKYAHAQQHGLHWLIAGGESGPRYRGMDLKWLRSIVNQSKALRIPCFVKQDSHSFPGRQGRISDALWGIKEWP